MERRPAAPAQSAAAAAAPPSTVDTASARPAREGDPGVTPPVVVSQALPRWSPPSAGPDRYREYDGVIEVVIDPQGTVAEATMRASVHPQYDPELLRMARGWKFKPAMKNGRPVAYAKLVEVRLRPAAR
jgi:TonB family protein